MSCENDVCVIFVSIHPYAHAHTTQICTFTHERPQKYRALVGVFTAEEVLTEKWYLSTLRIINANKTQFPAQCKQSSYVLISGLGHRNGDKSESAFF